MKRNIALLLFCSYCFICNGKAQNSQSKMHFIIEDVWNEKVYHSHLDSLFRVDNRSPKRKEIRKYNQLYGCSSSVIANAAEIESKHSWGEELFVFGKAFTLDQKQTTIDEIVYQTEELDSQIHYLTFELNNFSETTQVSRVTLSSKNVRSGKIKPRYVYYFMTR